MPASTTRAAMLLEHLEQHPTDAFARYGLAMEYSNAGELDSALQQFRLLLAGHPDYVAGFFMAAQALARAGRIPEAKTYLSDGMSAASRAGDQHAQAEMSAMLDDLP